MGICVGLQAFFLGSTESSSVTGLGLINKTLTQFNKETKSVPQIGWNSVSLPQRERNQKLYGLDPESRYYFVHSYAGILTSDEIKANEIDGWEFATARYGEERFIAAVSKDNIFATQFHPEKSGIAGLKVIKDFLEGNKYLPISVKSSSALANSTPIEQTQTGLTRRIIACLDVRTNDSGDLVVTKGDQYDVREKSASGNVRNLGKPVEMAEKYYNQGADEVTFLNITSFRNSPFKDTPMLEVLKETSKTVFVPLTIGGGIRDVVDPDGTVIPAKEVASLYFRSGADKVSIGSDAVYAAEKFYERGSKGDGTSPMETISKAYGIQAVVISVDPKRVYVQSPADTKHKTIETKFLGPNNEKYVWYQCTVKGGRESRDLGVWEFVKAVEALGAGEILLNCIDKDGTNSGFDLELINHVKEAISLPVIASSGAGIPQHFEEVFKKTKVDAALGAGMFHRGEYKVSEVKDYLTNHGLLVRIDNEKI